MENFKIILSLDMVFTSGEMGENMMGAINLIKSMVLENIYGVMEGNMWDTGTMGSNMDMGNIFIRILV